MFALSTVGMLLVWGGTGRGAGQRQAALDEERRDYLRYLAAGGGAGCARWPSSSERPSSTCTRSPRHGQRCWRRTGCGSAAWAISDFGQLRIGRGAQRLATRLVAPQTGPVEGIEPLSALALRRFLRGHAAVPDLPVAVSVRGTSTVWLESEPVWGPWGRPGPSPERWWRSTRCGTTRGTRCSRGSSRHRTSRRSGSGSSGCRTSRIRATATRSARCASSPRRRTTCGGWWAAELAGRPPGSGAGEPHLLMVVDEAAGPGPWATVAGATVVRVGAPPARRPGPSVVRLVVGAQAARARGPERVGHRHRASGRPVRRRGPGPGAPAGPLPPRGLGGRHRPARPGRSSRAARAARARDEGRGGGAARGARRRRPAAGTDRRQRTAPRTGHQGVRRGGWARTGCASAPGFRETSSCARVLGMCRALPAEPQPRLVDFKGGATFLGLERAPHVAAVITNLADELPGGPDARCPRR